MLTMVDYNIGNLRSVQKALEFVGAKVHLTSDVEEIAKAEKLVLPGVGAFGAGMAALREREFPDVICETARRGVPLLGVCVGMQFLFEESEEMGQHDGLGLIPGKVVRFSHTNGLKVPHMGWNQIHHDESHPLLKNVPSGAYTYFVHSYHCQVEDSSTTIAHTDYGLNFSAIVGYDNIFGLQFHPEKSHKIGLQILANYVNL